MEKIIKYMLSYDWGDFMSKKIFFFDIDGTILQEQSMSKRVFDALNNINNYWCKKVAITNVITTFY